MKILITGNMGYVGPKVVQHLREVLPSARLVGFDQALFGTCLTGPVLPEKFLDLQIFGDVRELSSEHLAGVDAVVHLAAISNDPMGKQFELATMEINAQATLAVAKKARKAGVRSFVFASSCSVYGAADGECDEASPVAPLTAYARSKALAEEGLAKLATKDFLVTSLRFATACGFSPRCRLDLVLNDFVANALTKNEIFLKSDGFAWRPLIHVEDMARAIEWAITRKRRNGGECAIVNAGSDEWNYRIGELAKAVTAEIPSSKTVVDPNGQRDVRSYRVSFAKFRELAPNHQPLVTLKAAICDLREGLSPLKLATNDPRYIRLSWLMDLITSGVLSQDLKWRKYPLTARAA